MVEGEVNLCQETAPEVHREEWIDRTEGQDEVCLPRLDITLDCIMLMAMREDQLKVDEFKKEEYFYFVFDFVI